MVNENASIQNESTLDVGRVLKGARDSLISLLKDYKDEIPDDLISGKCDFKCQNGWFAMLSGKLSMVKAHFPDGAKIAPVSDAVKEATDFVDDYIIKSAKTRKGGNVHRAETEDIKTANEKIRNIIRAINGLIGDSDLTDDQKSL
jgi:hypothetical protein